MECTKTFIIHYPEIHQQVKSYPKPRYIGGYFRTRTFVTGVDIVRRRIGHHGNKSNTEVSTQTVGIEEAQEGHEGQNIAGLYAAAGCCMGRE